MNVDLNKMMESITNLHDQTGKFINETNFQPAPDSQAMKERSSFPREESVVTAHSQGWLLFEAAADQLMGLTKLLTEPVQTIAPWTSVRALIEASALAAWLLNPNIDVSTRVQRSFAFRFDGLTEQVKFLRALDNKIELAKAILRIDHVEKLALELGYPRIEKDDKRTGIGQNMPSVTEIVKLELDQEAAYRLSSAMIHVHGWAITQLSFKTLEEATMVVNRGDGSSFSINALEKHMDSRSVIYLSQNALVSFARPIWYQCVLFGWNRDILQKILNENFDVMNIGEDKRFWNQRL